MPVRDAAQIACVAQAFVCSWRCHPCLDLSEQTFGNGYRKYGSARDFNRKVDHILKNHSGIGVKAFKFNVPSVYDADSVHLDRLDSWLQIAVKPGIKELRLILTADENNFAFYARTNLPSLMPNLEALSIRSYTEMVNTPMVPSKFLPLKSLSIAVGGLTFDFLSLASFLDASPSLQTFILEIFRESKERVSVFEDHSDMRMMPGHHHSKLKHVKIIKFSAAKSLAELTCHILESATSLKCLTLDTTHGMPRCSVNRTGKCSFMLKEAVVEAQKGVLAAQAFIKPKVPPTVEFNVLEPCTWWHDVGSYF
ncbi:unnamed protein product [Urochloa decumbens]|uniref:At1g61320/AtMIF1 LRR domain-containing protein n=1 Tax=Urochloa decumbens TaxID=240449 RepID=A0ABC9EDT7_9POAL